jgi:hypothetical protein
MLRDGPDNDDSIVGILEDRAGEVIYKWVKKEPLARSLKDNLLKDKKGRGREDPLAGGRDGTESTGQEYH